MNRLIIALAIICFTACLKTADDPVLIIDPVMWSHSAVWVEVSKGTEGESGLLIENGSELRMWWNNLELNDTAYMGGTFEYNTRNFHVTTDTAGYYIMKDSLLVLYKYPDEGPGKLDTIAVLKYTISQNQLIIKDTVAVPAIEYVYQKKP